MIENIELMLNIYIMIDAIEKRAPGEADNNRRLCSRQD